MDVEKHPSPAAIAFFTLMAIKGATEDFERGEANVLDTLDEIAAAVGAFAAAASDRTRREAA